MFFRVRDSRKKRLATYQDAARNGRVAKTLRRIAETFPLSSFPVTSLTLVSLLDVGYFTSFERDLHVFVKVDDFGVQIGNS